MTDEMEAIVHNVSNLVKGFRSGRLSGWTFAHTLEDYARAAVAEARRAHTESLPLCTGCGCHHHSHVMCPPHEVR